MSKVILFYAVVFISMLSCTRHLLQPQFITLNGHVSLQGQSDIEEVQVALYAAAAIDSSLAERAGGYPALPSVQTQPQMFDHRRAGPLYETTADAQGNYEFVDVPQASYNLVIEKRGYGWRYLYNVNGDDALPDVTLMREMRQSGVLSTYTEWPANQHVIVSGNITVPGNGALLIDKGAVVRFDGNFRINGEGQINCFGTAGNPVWFTSNAVGKTETHITWAGINVLDAGTFLNVRMDWAKIAVSVRAAVLKIDHSTFAHISDTGVFASRESNVDISQSLFYDSHLAVALETQSHGKIDHTVFSNLGVSSESSGIVTNAATVQVHDNLFSNCSRGVSMLYGAAGEIKRNVIDECTVGIYNFSFDRDVPVLVENNTVSASENYFIEIHHASTPMIHFNNFIGSTGQKYIYAYSQSLYYYEDLDATQNYWDGLPASEASRLMLDERQIKEGGGDVTWKILVEPVVGEMIDNAHPL